MNLTEAFIKKLNDPNLSEDYTVDDFYEEMGVLKEERSDFATAAMLKQVKDCYDANKQIILYQYRYNYVRRSYGYSTNTYYD